MFLLKKQIPLYGIVLATPLTDLACCLAAVLMLVNFLHMVQKKEPVMENT